MVGFARHAGWILVLLLATAAARASAPDEYQVEAVFLLHFTQFVEWPPQAFRDARSPFVIGVLGQDPFGSALDEAVHGETVNGRPLVVKRFAGAADLSQCQILFIDRSAVNEAAHVIQSLSHTGTLTVSNVEMPAPADVVIRFLNEDRRIRLRINLDYARSAGLTISSKLLRPSQVVGTPPAS